MHLFCGFNHFGAGNFGDDLTLAGFLRASAALAPGLEITICTPYDIESQRLRFPEIRWIPDDAATRDDALASADAWFGLGGTPFQLATGPWMLDSLERERERCLELSLPMFYLGCGNESEDAVRDERAVRLIDAAAVIWTRDDLSAQRFELVAPNCARLGAELAHISLAAMQPPARDVGVLGMLLGLDARETVDMNALDEALAAHGPERVRWLVQEARTFPCTELYNYGELSDSVRSTLRVMPLAYSTDSLATMLRSFGAPETVLSSRYHGALTAAWHGCKLAVIARSGKLAGAAHDLAVPSLDRIATAADVESLTNLAAPVALPRLQVFERRAFAMCEEFFACIAEL